MTELLPVFITSIVLAWFSHLFSTYDDRLGVYVKKEHILFIIIAIIMSVFIGLRTEYNDTVWYILSYKLLLQNRPDSISEVFQNTDWTIGNNPGFSLVNNIFAYLNVEPEQFIMIYSLVTNCIFIWFIGKYSNNRVLSLYLFIIVEPYIFTAAAIKQCIAMAFLALATDRAIEKKYVRFFIWVAIATTFHAYSWIYLIVLLLDFKPWTKKTYWMLGFFAAVGVSLQVLVGTLINVTSMLGDEYSVTEMSGDGVNIFRVAVTLVPIILSFILRKRFDENFFNRSNNIMLNLTMFQGALMFVGLFGTANYFARLANYFSLFACITIPWLFKYIDKKRRTIVVLAAVILYFLYFYYGNVIIINFDNHFDRLTLKEYFQATGLI